MSRDTSKLQLADALKSRFLLMVGGVFGAHRLYLNQIPEAFIYLSTAGVFLLGIFHDSFFLNNEVKRYNERKLKDEEDKKYKNAKLISSSHIVPFSLARFVSSILYGIWLGALCWMAGSVTFGRTAQDSLAMTSAMAAAVTAGVYLVGNCGGQCRDLLYMWIGSFSTAFLVCKVLDENCLRTLLFSSIAATLLGNRTAQMRTPNQKSYTWKHFLFWSSLFALLLCVIAVGGTRHILDRRVSATVPGKSSVTSSIGSLVYDRIMNPQRVRRFFKDEPNLEYKKAKAANFKKKEMWWDVDIVGRAPAWADLAAVLVVDLLWAETKALNTDSQIEPLKWAAWRLYLITVFDVHPFIMHKDLNRMCIRWLQDHNNVKTGRTENDSDENYKKISIRRACETIMS